VNHTDVHRIDVRIFLGSTLAVVIPAVLLHWAADPDRHRGGLTTPPFAWPRVLVAHFIAALPLAWLVAARLRKIPDLQDTSAALWIIVGLFGVAAGMIILPGIGQSLVTSEAGFITALLLRATVAFSLVLPWCMAFCGKITQLPSGWAWSVGVGLAAVPCGVYCQAVISNRTEVARDLLERERLVKARSLVLGLCELGSQEPLGSASPHQVLKYLDDLLPKLERAVAQLSAVPVSPSTRLQRATLLVRLDQLEEAAELLRPGAATDPNTAVFLAGIYRDLNRWVESTELYIAALEYFRPRSLDDPSAAEMCRLAYEGLVFICRQTNRHAEVERLLFQGLEVCPAEAAFFHCELGKHYAEVGRPAQAAYHLDKATRLDPIRYSRLVENLRFSLLNGPYGCSFPRP
jgi:hypothetical protein